jgi:protein-glutamine gamma-glutamyltransferase
MGTWFLGWGQESYVLPLLLTIAAVVSLAPLTYSRYLRLNRLVANFAALVAVSWSLRNFLELRADQQLLAIADMLIYLQIVLLFQDKSNRVYWQLLVLSVLQVVVAAALNLGPAFAMLLAVYMSTAISTLVLLCVHSERGKPASASGSDAAGTPVWQRLLSPPEIVETSDADAATRSVPQLFFRQVGMLTFATFLFTVVFFYSTPRLGDGAWLGSRPGGVSTTGFSSDLVLEEAGTIQQSNELVMRVRFNRAVDRRPYPLIDEPYFHGVVLTHYRPEPGNHRWLSPLVRHKRGEVGMHVNQPTSANALIRQDIALENPAAPIIFAVMPYHPLADTPQDLRYIRQAHRLVRMNHDDIATAQEYRYAFGTMAFRDGRQLKATPHYNACRTRLDRMLLSDELTDLTEFDAERFTNLARVAEQVLQEQELLDGSKLDQITALQNHFRIPGAYRYSLSMSYERDPDLDPIEDFVANHRTGHCEYFAAALALMLRSRGIPSRIVTGYKGGEFNTLGSYYQVRQKHAHAWVEAYLSAEETPMAEVAGIPSGGGSWFRLDPTPVSLRRVGGQDDPTLGEKIGDTFDYVELLWRDYVLGLNSTKQKDTFFDPLTRRTAGSLPGWFDMHRAHRMARRWRQDAAEDTSRLASGAGAAIGVLVLGLAAAGGARVAYLVLRRRGWLGFSSGRKTSGAKALSIEFYRRMEKLLARLRLRRKPGQTPLEFARQAAESLQRLVDDIPPTVDRHDLPALPTRIVNAYYNVRFGGARLDNREVDAIEHALAQLVVATSKRKS